MIHAMNRESFPSNDEMREQIDVLETRRLAERLATLRAEVEDLSTRMKSGALDLPMADKEMRTRLDEAEKIQHQLGKIHSKYQ